MCTLVNGKDIEKDIFKQFEKIALIRIAETGFLELFGDGLLNGAVNARMGTVYQND